MTAKTLVDRITDVGEDQSNLCVVLRGVGTAALEVLLVADEIGRWSIPGGHVNGTESHAAACVREVREETGLEVEVQPLMLADHVARKIPISVFYAVVDDGSEARPGGGDVTEVKWTPVNALGDLNGTDKLVINVAANRVHDPDGMIDDAVEMAESLGFATAVVASAMPEVVEGRYVRLMDSAAFDYLRKIMDTASRLGWPVTTTQCVITETARETLIRASNTRRLTPMLDGLIRAADAIWNYEDEIAPRLVLGELVLEIGENFDRAHLINRGLPEDLVENLAHRIPQPATCFYCGDKFEQDRMDVFSEALEQMRLHVVRP